MICKKCKNKFPNKIWIDGKQRILNKRKYCLKCSPFNKHNTIPLEKYSVETKCIICNKKYKYNREKGDRRNKCKNCRQKEKRTNRRLLLIEKAGGKCKICGYNKCFAALSFHHREPSKKLFQISGNETLKLEKVLNEIKKCDLLCLNCHAELHSK